MRRWKSELGSAREYVPPLDTSMDIHRLSPLKLVQEFLREFVCRLISFMNWFVFSGDKLTEKMERIDKNFQSYHESKFLTDWQTRTAVLHWF